MWSWGKTETQEGAVVVEKLLSRFEKEIDVGNDLMDLNQKYYTVAVDAWGKSGNKESAKHAERILHKMEGTRNSLYQFARSNQ